MKLPSLNLKQQTMLMAVVASTLPVLAIGAVTHQAANRVLIQQNETAQRARAADLQRTVYRFMEEREHDIRIMANLSIFTRADLRAQLSAEEKGEILDQLMAEYEIYDSIAVFDISGNIVAQTTGTALRNHLDRSYIQTTLETEQVVLSQPIISTTAGTFSIYAANVIRDADTQQVIGFVRSRMAVEVFKTILKSYNSEDEDYYLISQNDEVFLDSNNIYFTQILSTGETFTHPNHEASFQIYDLFPILESSVQAAQSTTLLASNTRTNDQEFLTYNPPLVNDGLPDVGWQTVVTKNRALVLEPQRELERIVLLGTGLTALLVSISAAYFANKIIQPVLSAADTAQALGQGKLAARAEVIGPPELRQLGSNINSMAQRIQQLLTERAEKTAHLKDLNQQLSQRTEQLEQEVGERKHTEAALRQSQAQLVQTEKMSSLGQLVAGIAHEINNPVNFIHGNLRHVKTYTEDLLNLIDFYQQESPEVTESLQAVVDSVDLTFVQEDLPKVVDSMQMGTSRIREIVKSLRIFSRLDEAACKAVNIHEGIDSAVMILQNRLKASRDRPEITVVRDYGSLPPVECYPGQLNQVFLNLLSNAIDALDERHQQDSQQALETASGMIQIRTQSSQHGWVEIAVRDNGLGIAAATQSKLFDPFFTTKPVGKGTGLGLSISYQIVTEKHQGHLRCSSMPGEWTQFTISIPMRQTSTLVEANRLQS
ncbi:MAG: ATP-binding protein [Cyanobacteria bacterium J06626_4]